MSNVAPQSMLALFAGGILVGFIGAKQFVIAPEIQKTTEQDQAHVMAVETAELYRSNTKLRGEISDLTAQKQKLAAGTSPGESENALQAAITQLKIVTGQETTVGPGVQLTFSQQLQLSDLVDLLNAFRNIGAEAIAVNKLRVVDHTGFIDSEIKNSSSGNQLNPPLVFEVIGPPSLLKEALTRKGGVLSQMNASYTIEEQELLELPAVK